MGYWSCGCSLLNDFTHMENLDFRNHQTMSCSSNYKEVGKSKHIKGQITGPNLPEFGLVIEKCNYNILGQKTEEQTFSRRPSPIFTFNNT